MAKKKASATPAAGTLHIIKPGEKGMAWSARGRVHRPGPSGRPGLDVHGRKEDDLHHKVGRPSPAADIIREEARERLAIPGQVSETQTLNGFAEVLEKWFAKTYPDLRAPKWTAVRNMIRRVWGELHYIKPPRFSACI